EADAAGARPRNHRPLGIGDRDRRVVERRVDVRVSVVDDALLAALLERLLLRGASRGLLGAAFGWRGGCGDRFVFSHQSLDRLLLGDGALARPLPRARIGLRALAADREVAAVPEAAPAADLHQPLDVHRDFLAQVAFDPALLLDDAADLPDVVFRQVLDADVRADARRDQDVVRPLPADPVDVGQPDFDALRARKIDTSNTCHVLLVLIPDAACASGSGRSRAPRRGGG